MKFRVLLVVLFLLAFTTAGTAAQGAGPASMEQYRQVKGSLDQAFQTKAGVYSKDVLEEAGRTLAKALESIEAKNQKAARESLDKALLQIELARAKMQEREAAEKTAVTRARADKLSQRLAEILAGKGDDK